MSIRWRFLKWPRGKLSRSSSEILTLLKKKGSMTVREIAKQTNYSPHTIIRILSDLRRQRAVVPLEIVDYKQRLMLEYMREETTS